MGGALAQTRGPSVGYPGQAATTSAPEAATEQPYGNAAANEQLPAGGQGDSLLAQIEALGAGGSAALGGPAQPSTGSVPQWVIDGVIAVEQADLSTFEGPQEAWKKWRQDWTVSLGPAQIQVRRAAELDHPKRDWKSNPLTEAEFAQYVAKLEDPATNVSYLVREMQDNFAFYGRKPGKSDDDRWRFAVAKHKGGHGPIGTAQAAAIEHGLDANLWVNVALFLPGEIASFVVRVEACG